MFTQKIKEPLILTLTRIIYGQIIKSEILKNIYIYIYLFTLSATCSNYSRCYYSIIKNSNKMNNNILYYSIDIANNM